jgi:membrane protein implicated in regulation of membrane protease activity
MQGIPWWLWAILAALVAYAELHAPGSYLIWIGLGAALTAALEASVALSLRDQITAFIVASALSCGVGYFVYRRVNRGKQASDALNQRDMSMIGAKGIVCEPFENGAGKVRLGDSVWLAEGPNLSEGTSVIVKSVRGTRVIVEEAPARSD